MKKLNLEESYHMEEFLSAIKVKSDFITDFFLLILFCLGLLLAFYYDTWDIAFGVGGLSLLAYYSAKYALPKSDFYQYVLSVVLGIFMAQFIYQMHGMFEMHFFAFIGSTFLITYQNWKLQIPISLVVVVHHALFAYLQYIGYDKIYFTQLDYMTLQTFIIHGILASIIFFICGLWAYQFNKFNAKYIEQTFTMGKLQQEELEKEKRSVELIKANKELALQYQEKEKLATELSALVKDLEHKEELLHETGTLAKIGGWELIVSDLTIRWTDEVFHIHELEPGKMPPLEEAINYYAPEARPVIQKAINIAITNGKDWNLELPFITAKGKHLWVKAIGKVEIKNGKTVRLFGVFQDITERKKAELKLERNIAQLTKSNSELDKFVYSVSHDLRAPLSSILGVLEIAQDDTNEEIIHDHLKMLKGNVKKLDGFVADILDYSRNSRKDVIKERINFKELLTDITQNLKFMGSNNRNVDIKIEVNDEIPVLSDRTRLTFILNNLVSNAIRYQNSRIPHPFVDIKIDTSETETGIIVQDNGIGIRSELHNKIFDMFYRVSEDSIGSGLGLYIVKEAVAKLNGHIALESAVGEGSKFTIKIPNN
ncbi:MAG TPA: ATP-binding protein [Saprospiraceae bacterium]|nr:ATP-binding protein [Saprospiraceae bacterium]